MLFRRPAPDLPLGGEIRRAERRDIPRLVELWSELMALHQSLDPHFAVTRDAPQVMARRFQFLLQERDALVLVSEADGQVVGFGAGHVDQNLPFFPGATIGFISDVFVAESHRRQGRATRLVQALRQWFHHRRVASIQLHAAACNPEAHAFWRRMGFRDYLVRMWADS